MMRLVLSPSGVTDIATETLAARVIAQRLSRLNTRPYQVRLVGHEIMVDVTGASSADSLVASVTRPGRLEFRHVVATLPASGALANLATNTAAGPPFTPADQVTPGAAAVLPQSAPGADQVDAKVEVGPAELDGSSVADATALAPQSGFDSWTVSIRFQQVAAFDKLATRYYQQQVAIVVDGVVISAPTINAQSFGGKAEISGGAGGFTEQDADALAANLASGPLPTVLQQQSVQQSHLLATNETAAPPAGASEEFDTPAGSSQVCAHASSHLPRTDAWRVSMIGADCIIDITHAASDSSVTAMSISRWLGVSPDAVARADSTLVAQS
jgi:preprotein translocase subunit SecD